MQPSLLVGLVPSKIEKFSDFIYDTNDMCLLKHGYRLLYRVAKHYSTWRLCKMSEEWRNESDILQELSKIVNIDAQFMPSICPNIVASLKTTRVTFDSPKEFFVDFSSWLRMGIAGMVVIESTHETCDCMKACLSDVAKDAFNLTFSEEERKTIYPIMRSNDNPYSFLNYHRMTTLEQL